jgi:hypothetical protein
MGRLPWALAAFPQGYELYPTNRPARTRTGVPRRDFLLYGTLITSRKMGVSRRKRRTNRGPQSAPHRGTGHQSIWYVRTSLRTSPLTQYAGSTDVPPFASPLDFVLHAEWLMRGAHCTVDKSRAPQCKCNYCDVDVRNREQSEISRELRASRTRVLVQLEDGNADDTDA